ncbi:MAG: hypothetical protein OXP71_08060 [Candidatus Poribacteria bacterium]|nr:hypothetical protein [Candidatus Poribacteria bacterium]
MFTSKQKILVGVAVLVAVLLVAGSYFGSRWLFGPDIKPTPEHLLTAEPSYFTSVSRGTPSVSGADWVSELEQSFSDTDSATESDSTQIDEDLEAQLAALSDEEFTALAEALEQEETKSSKYPPVPDGFPSDLKPVWLEDYFDEDDFSNHVTMYRVLIELWNQGDHDFVNGSIDTDTGKVYPLYHDVVYVTWDSYFREGPNGEPIEVKYLSSNLGTHDTVGSFNDAGEDLFTEEEIMSGAYLTKYPGLKLVDYNSAGYHPANVLNDY